MKTFKLFASAAVACMMLASPALAGVVDDFNTPGTPGWTVDRMAPASFNDGVAYNGHLALVEQLSATDYQGAGSFYNTQGRALNLAPGTTSMSVQLYADSAFLNAGGDGRVAGFWGVTAGGPDAPAYPIIELHKVGSDLVFKGWDNNGLYFDIATLGAGDYNKWQTLKIDIVGTDFVYTALGNTTTTSAFSTTSIGSVILQGHNNGQDLNVAWDNLRTGGAVPEPATWAMMLMGFGGLGAALRRRRATTTAFA